MAMSKRDFVAIASHQAEVVNQHKSREAWVVATCGLANTLRTLNSSFSFTTFLRACGVVDGEWVDQHTTVKPTDDVLALAGRS